jgi:UDP-N-acetylglucosamine 2-epimerase (non-hydrolysing)
MNTSPVAIVLGTRPEIIKLAPVIRALQVADRPFILIHTNQHYSVALDAIFFTELNLPKPDYNLEVGPGTQNVQTARMIERLDPIFLKEKPSCVIVQGDTNSVLAGALVGSKLLVPVVHVEAGLRSNDRTMPEEINRIITDHISDLLLPPTQACADTLLAEGIVQEKIVVVGNTVADGVLQHKDLATEQLLEPFGISRGNYFLLTMHRPSNVDTKEDLSEIIEALRLFSQRTETPIIFPIHPRTKGNLERFGIELPKEITCLEPQGYLTFLALEKYARAVVTDSGGAQEEACILGVPCLTLRENTERPETTEVGANLLVPRDAEVMVAALTKISGTKWSNPFGDGKTGERIVGLLK